MLSALNRSPELGNHVRGAIRNGCTEVEIRETLLQVSCVQSPPSLCSAGAHILPSIYCGMPAGLEAFKVAERVINEMKAEEVAIK